MIKHKSSLMETPWLQQNKYPPCIYTYDFIKTIWLSISSQTDFPPTFIIYLMLTIQLHVIY